MPSREGKTVLVIDDHPIFRDALAVLLHNSGIFESIATVDNLTEADSVLSQQEPDLLLLDLFLGPSGGISETLMQINVWMRTFPSLRILVISGVPEPTYAQRALTAGAQGFFSKAESLQNLQKAIRNILKGKPWLSPLFFPVSRPQAHTSSPTKDHDFSHLSNREVDVLHATGLGRLNREIAYDLGLSVKTIETYKEHLKQKLDCEDAKALRMAAQSYVQALWS